MERKDNLLGVLATLYQNRNLILKVCGAVFIGSIIISLLLPKFYKSTTTFYAASTDLINPDKMFGGGKSEVRYYGTAEDLERLLTIAQGAEVVEYLVNKYNLYEHYDIDTSSVKAGFYIREHFNGLYEVQKTKFDAIELSVEDEDPKLAAAIANDARKRIEEISSRLIKNSQETQLNTLKKSIKTSEEDLHAIGDSLARLREKYGIYDPDTQGETISSLYSSTRMQKSKLDGKLESYKSTPGTPRDSIRKVSAELKGIETQMVKLQEDLKLFNEGSSVVLSLSDHHETARNQINWDKERQKHVLAAFNSDISTIHLVESAEVPIVKSRPVRSILVLASTFAALLFMVIGILIFDNFKEVNWKEVFGEESLLKSTHSKKKEPIL